MMQHAQQMGSDNQQKPGTKSAPLQQGQSGTTAQQGGVTFNDWASI
ncbi:hypothetical protein OE699_06395 [Sedimentimonas flavescens]|uniref:Uncharacterized protein n=1 Tax=Sedimentimonas flavescens TaxID=2851012 RepID=A0ABT2ZXL9_9RHOB|nr:hypothetical protein [Sedimentimonas flavescens]MCV2878479.1 hypothetical protein [Sedimentimonas flavescens]